MHRLMVVGTYRQTELIPQHALTESLAELTRYPAYLRLHLSGFSRDETARFIQSAGGASPSPEALAEIHDRTEGHPLFLVETVRYLRVETRAGTSPGQAYTDALKAIPEGVREIIGKYLSLAKNCRNDTTSRGAFSPERMTAFHRSAMPRRGQL